MKIKKYPTMITTAKLRREWKSLHKEREQIVSGGFVDNPHLTWKLFHEIIPRIKQLEKWGGIA